MPRLNVALNAPWLVAAALGAMAAVGLPVLAVLHRATIFEVFQGVFVTCALIAVAFLIMRIRNPWVAAFVVTGLVVLTRLIAFRLFVPGQLGADPGIYLDVAKNIVAGRGHVISDAVVPGSQRAAGPPLFPFLLAAMMELLGPVRWAALPLNIVADLISGWLLFQIARRWSQSAALLAAALYLLAPSTIITCVLASKEPLSIAFLLTAAFAILLSFDGGRLWRAAGLFGFGMAGLAVTQPALLPLPPLLMLIYAWRVRWPIANLLWVAGVALLLFSLLLSPWWVRNARIYHEFVPLTTAGPAALAAIYPEPNAPPLDTRVSEPEARRAQGHAAWGHVERDPFGYLKVVAYQAMRTMVLNDEPVLFTRSFKPIPADEVENPAFIALQLAYVVLLSGGAFALRRRGWQGQDRPDVPILIAIVLQIGIFGIWVEFKARHREYFVPLLCLAIASGKVRQDERSRSIRPPTIRA